MGWKEGDVFRWSWNDRMLEKLSGCSNNIIYWCKSRIGIVYSDGMLHDTYWSGSNDTRWYIDRARDELELTYLGNLNDYRKAEPYERTCYKDSDCLDLNHPNSTRGNFYIRKDAVQCKEKKRKVLERSKKRLELDIKYQLQQIERYGELLNNKSYENMQSLPYEKDVGIFDEDYLDYED